MNCSLNLTVANFANSDVTFFIQFYGTLRIISTGSRFSHIYLYKFVQRNIVAFAISQIHLRLPKSGTNHASPTSLFAFSLLVGRRSLRRAASAVAALLRQAGRRMASRQALRDAERARGCRSVGATAIRARHTVLTATSGAPLGTAAWGDVGVRIPPSSSLSRRQVAGWFGGGTSEPTQHKQPGCATGQAGEQA